MAQVAFRSCDSSGCEFGSIGIHRTALFVRSCEEVSDMYVTVAPELSATTFADFDSEIGGRDQRVVMRF